MISYRSIGVVIFLIFLQFETAHAWEAHKNLMPWVVRSLSEDNTKTIDKAFQISAESQINILPGLIRDLKLNPATKLDELKATNARAVFLSQAIDESDFGMDENLDDTADPKNDRPFMGGKTGPTSKGFRHMYFGGWQLSHPIRTFQIPTRALGQSPERVWLIAQKAQAMLQTDDRAWAFRVLTWAMHLIQDLSQPFHAAQAPSLRMPVWSALAYGFDNLVKETTRTISNYHWAYEDYVTLQLPKGDKSPFSDCLSRPETYANVHLDAKALSPLETAHLVAQASVELAPEVGASVMGFFGNRLKEPGIDLPAKKGTPDYEKLAQDPALSKERQRLEAVTCKALANGVIGSKRLIEWALKMDRS